MALGTVLAKRWQPAVSPLTFTAWQLVAGGLLLAPFALTMEPPLPSPTFDNVVGFAWLGLFGAALSYCFGFAAWRGSARKPPASWCTIAPTGPRYGTCPSTPSGTSFT